MRGIANSELSCDLAFKLGRAGAMVLAKNNSRPKILIGRDTRISGDMLESALVAGLCSMGADVVCAGVIPTPGVSYLVQKLQMDAGVVISASHNPVQYLSLIHISLFCISMVCEDMRWRIQRFS